MFLYLQHFYSLNIVAHLFNSDAKFIIKISFAINVRL